MVFKNTQQGDATGRPPSRWLLSLLLSIHWKSRCGMFYYTSWKSTSRFVFMLAGGVIFWKSVKQSLIVSSTMEAEFMACFEATNQALRLRNFISGFGVVDSITKQLKLFCDNTAVIFFSKNDKYSSGSKHIEMKYLVVRERVHKQQASIENLSTTMMIADPLTKALQCKTFKEHVLRMGLLS
ncbi:hypothetical protein OPV22_002321 [Ensete ventricosum]|uniref:Reverse transcriptase Ty1/copia-type domain-containing protein n=1 Tax=Ensete ventricosum TaxID=4639 RepID=A0AAV8RXK4_ENSVE|nr:hypothetical protein OPV22_002321 [Ensete ventricosum]